MGDSTATPQPLVPPRVATAAGALAIVAAVGIVYRDAAVSYFFNDGLQWIQGSWQFSVLNLLDLSRYSHFYRPIIEIYFFAGRTLFGCAPLPFHLASIGIHLLNTLLLFLLARALSGARSFAFLAALLFSVQPGYVQAVAWVGAITDLLPATWFLLTLWLHLRYLQHGSRRAYAGALAAFTGCLLTHESSAVLLPMMLLLDFTVWQTSGRPRAERPLVGRVVRYAPFAILLAAYLVLEIVVSRRSYLLQEGHYAFGWHAVPHALDYVVALYVGKHNLGSYTLIGLTMAVLLWKGTWKVRFFVLWMLVTLAPVVFFTWPNASRYLYVPAAGFALLVAAGLVGLGHLAAARWSPRAARTLVAFVATVLAARFAVFAADGSKDFRNLTRPYERLAAAVRTAYGSDHASEVTIDRADLENIPELYRDPAASVAVCAPELHVLVR